MGRGEEGQAPGVAAGPPHSVGESVALGWMRVTQAEIWLLLLPDRKHNHETA